VKKNREEQTGRRAGRGWGERGGRRRREEELGAEESRARAKSLSSELAERRRAHGIDE
jgi:hypothetical protein